MDQRGTRRRAPTDRLTVLERRVASLDSRTLTTQWPSTRRVFTNHFGSGCFDCPAFGMETVEFACAIHHADVSEFVGECLALMRETLLTLPMPCVVSRFPAAEPALQRQGLFSGRARGLTLGQAVNGRRLDRAGVLRGVLSAIVP